MEVGAPTSRMIFGCLLDRNLCSVVKKRQKMKRIIYNHISFVLEKQHGSKKKVWASSKIVWSNLKLYAGKWSKMTKKFERK